jgi:hypothetical protein
MKEYNRNPEMKNRIDEMFDDLEVLTATVRFGAGGTSKEIEELKFIESNPTFDLRYCVPMLALKNILLIGGWDNHMVSFEQIILPFYRALQDGNAAKVEITAITDDHKFKNSRAELAQIIFKWLKSLDKEE